MRSFVMMVPIYMIDNAKDLFDSNSNIFNSLIILNFNFSIIFMSFMVLIVKWVYTI
jgi:hypothetical protein